jgi:NADH dehydrogenase [ubiquinone] 1 alpha subcomplex assembly factor 7
MTPLESELRVLIAQEGPISVARYMALCLGHPRYGYYRTRDPFGVAGDFTTAPEISQIFGELLGLWCAAVWQSMGSPRRINLVELGPGRGTLMRDLLRAAAALPGFTAALSVHLVETSPVLHARQKAMLGASHQDVIWHESIADVPDGPRIVLANEFFDALPVHQAVKGESGWHERRVGLAENGSLTFALDPHPLSKDNARAAGLPASAPLHAIREWRDPDMIVHLALQVARDGGAILMLDYGHEYSSPGDTLQAVRAHAYASVLEAPGECDLTAHVDFAAIVRATSQTGVLAHGPVTQRRFLQELGIDMRADKLKGNAKPEQRRAIEAGVQRLTGHGKNEMGELFKVLALSHPSLDMLPGFESVLAGVTA